ncbi:hypothetical protein AAFF_G00392940 [Aldrovandia affinis]|uniref:Uncharacterized protein n=1 Tax=Aldrovandia affinis TaxID=143900 RepID=A0AAD7R649_9TELE|nr:hypothetical protein AAFF_G00392940 [Aldrovandia affinis]
MFNISKRPFLPPDSNASQSDSCARGGAIPTPRFHLVRLARSSLIKTHAAGVRGQSLGEGGGRSIAASSGVLSTKGASEESGGASLHAGASEIGAGEELYELLAVFSLLGELEEEEEEEEGEGEGRGEGRRARGRR